MKDAHFLASFDAEVQEFIKKLGFSPDTVARVVLDIKADAALKAYVETFVSENSLQVLTNSPKGVEVEVVS